MTTTEERPTAGSPGPGDAPIGPEPIVARPFPAQQYRKGSLLSQMLRTTDHKLIGRMYMVTSLIFFAVGGVMALLWGVAVSLLTWAEMAGPGTAPRLAGAAMEAKRSASPRPPPRCSPPPPPAPPPARSTRCTTR